MRRTIMIFTAAALVATAFGLQAQERVERLEADTVSQTTFVLVIDGKIAAQAKPANPPGTQTAPSQIKILLPGAAGKGGGDIAMEELTLMSKDFQDWITRSLHGDVTLKRGVIGASSSGAQGQTAALSDLRKDITIELFSPEGRPLRAVVLNKAYISEVVFPKLDRTSKESAYLSIKIATDEEIVRKIPGRTTYQPITIASTKNSDTANVPKKWSVSNFRIKIGDLPCDRVSKVDSVTWKQSNSKDEVGSFRQPKTEQTRTGTQNINITLPMKDWNAWENWMNSSLLAKKEIKKASISVMSPDGSEGYMLNFHDVTIVALSVSETGQNLEDIKTFEVKLHYNETDFNFVHR